MPLHLLLALAALMLSSVAHCAINLPVGFQVHSWNDLRLWRQGFAKGVHWMKIDPHYVPGRNGSASLPFVLSHDPPSNLASYYTLEDVIHTLSQFQPWNLTIALCYKSDGSGKDPDYVAAVAASLQYMNSASQGLKYNVTWIVDGDATTPKGLFNRMTWVGSAASAHDNASCLVSSEGGCALQQVLDMNSTPFPFTGITSWIDAFCPLGFGRFSQLPFPFLVWEPSDEAAIHEVIDSFNACEISHQPGLLFAINLDPIHFLTYAGEQSRTRIEQWSAGSGVKIAKLSDTLAVLFSAPPLGQNGARLPSYAVASQCLISGTGWCLIHPSQQFACAFPDTVSVDTASGNILTCSGPTCCVSALASDGTLSLVTSMALPSTLENVQLAVGTPDSHKLHSLAAGTMWAVGRPTGALAATCALGIQLLGEWSQPVCLWAVSGGKTNIESFAAAAIGSHVVHVVATTAAREAYGLVFNGTAVIAGPSQFSVGSDPSVSADSTSGYVAVSLGSGYCFNSDWHNKRPLPHVCDAVPVAGTTGLTYTIASLDAWVAKLRSSSPIVTSCDDAFLHGMYDQGYSASIALVVAGDAVSVLVAHEPFGSHDVDMLGCGWPVSDTVILMHSFGFSHPPSAFDGMVPSGPSGGYAPHRAELRVADSVAAPANGVGVGVGVGDLHSEECDACVVFFSVLDAAVANDSTIQQVIDEVTKSCPVTKLIWPNNTSVDYCQNNVICYIPDLISSAAIAARDQCADLGACPTRHPRTVAVVNSARRRTRSSRTQGLRHFLAQALAHVNGDTHTKSEKNAPTAMTEAEKLTASRDVCMAVCEQRYRGHDRVVSQYLPNAKRSFIEHCASAEICPSMLRSGTFLQQQ